MQIIKEANIILAEILKNVAVKIIYISLSLVLINSWKRENIICFLTMFFNICAHNIGLLRPFLFLDWTVWHLFN